MADDTEEERVKMKSLKLDEPVQGEPNMYTNQPKANSDGHLVKKKTKGDDTVLEKNLHSSLVLCDLHKAVFDRNFGKVRHLLQRGADPNKISRDCFMRIIDMNDSRMLEVLIEGGLRLNKAVLNRDENKVAKLLKRDADLSQILDFVVHNGDIRMLKVMLAGGLELNQFPDNVLIRILRSSDKRMIEVLKEGRSELKQLPDNVLLEILRTSDERIIQSLKECGYELKQIPDNFINKCVYNRELQILKVFLEEGVDLKRIPDDCVQELAENCEIGILKVLIEGGLKLKQIPDNCIQELVDNREFGILKVLIEGGLKLKQIPDDCIQELVEKREIGILKVLIEGGLKLKQIPDDFIQELVEKREIGILKVLIEGGLKLKQIPDDCIQELVENREIEILKVLIEGGLKLKQIPDNCIQELVNNREIEILKVLIEGGLKLKQIPDNCIQELVNNREIEILKVLIEGGWKLKQISDFCIHELINNREIRMLKVLLEGGLKLKKIPDFFIKKVIVYKRHNELLKIFVEGGWDVNRISDSCIHELVFKRNIGMLKVLLEGGLELKRISEDVIDDLVNTRDIEILKALLKGGLEVKRISEDVIDDLVNTRDIEILKALLKGGLEVKRIPDPVIDRLVHTDDVEMLNVLVERGLVLKRLPRDTVTKVTHSAKEYVKFGIKKFVNTILDTLTDEDSELHPDGNITTKRMDGVEQIATVVQENDMESLMSLKDTFVAAYPIGESPLRLLHIVAVYGTAEMVDCIQRWTRIDWDRQYTIHEDIFKGASRYPKVKEATPLYLATCLERTETVRSLVKLAGEDNIRSCLQGLKFSNEIEHIFMLELADRLRQKHAELKPIIVPGHRREDNGTKSRVFIVYSMSVVRAKDDDFNGLGLVKLRNPYVIQRSNNFASGIEMDISNKSTETLSNDNVELSQKDAKRVREAIKTHGDHLWQKHSNLNIITGKQVNINGSHIGEACVVLYCSTKGVIPLGEEEFPRTLCIQNDVQIKVAVREGFFEFGVYKSIPSTWPHPTLKMGCEIGRLEPQIGASGHLPSGGTLGPFVRYNNNLGFLTCSHVLFDIPIPSHTIDYTTVGPPLIEVVQPSSDATPFVSGTPCGVVERALFDPTRPISIDAAVVKLTDQSRVPSAGQFSNERHSSYQNAGFDEIPEYNSGAMLTSAQVNKLPCKPNVVKFGSRTDVTRGALSVFGADVRAFSTTLGLPNNAGGVLMKNQYLVIGIYPSTDFFDGGDSGSGVFYQDSSNGQLQCVGMAIGHSVLENYPYKVGVVTPIDAILQALGPNISLATFP